MKRAYLTGLAVIAVCGAIAACGGSNADTVDKNLIKEAEQFKVFRSLTVTSGITGQVMYEVKGNCSFERPDSKRIDFLCKEVNEAGKSSFRKSVIALGDQDIAVIVQLEPVAVSQYRTTIIFRPEAIVPNFDLVTGDNP